MSNTNTSQKTMTQTHELVLASGNAGKIAELNDLLEPLGWVVHPQRKFGVSDADETGLTFIENALIKARHACEQTNLPALADDSGLAVDALGGAPGIYSARYAGAGAPDSENLHKLLDALQGIPAAERTAQFHCVLVYMRHAEDPTPVICHGVWEGTIATEPSGEGGFGYDPVFIAPETNCTAAELTKEQKRKLSHRGKALRKLQEYLSADTAGTNVGDSIR